ncbi:MAG: cupin domain-containing protein [Rhodospirillaceae bacterium]|jgi:mannose-6-phosphate isomerase-like protein (cupin superfamily)|nr:cupin domain-containing protein [Rhodospirillaceae bacterium]MBT3536053.1 cupin domain-containing protein [Rhodospirillaceae bacterium]MBT4486843.1 cupin domain-containing protein [Rhodospirillaceae bacterium]MBT5896246.1 cupin domain-containing protein [Rhodospirillaceae bacterium]MBT6428427.1 cupin domain-containing protein [Rhodospirillaceae bacterium]
MNDILSPEKFSLPLDADAVAADWRGRGYSCNLFVDPPGQQWLDFTHATNELVTVVEGRLEMVVGDTRVEMGPGDEIFIPARALHSVINIHDGVSRWLFGYD